MTQLQKKKFKEELIRGERPGTMRSIFSNNVIVEYPEVADRVPALAPGGRACRTSRRSAWTWTRPLSIVAGAKVFEIQCTSGQPLVRARRYRPRDARAVGAPGPRPLRSARRRVRLLDARARQGQREEQGREAADDFFKALQMPLHDYLARRNDEDRADLRRRGRLTPFDAPAMATPSDDAIDESILRDPLERPIFTASIALNFVLMALAIALVFYQPGWIKMHALLE